MKIVTIIPKTVRELEQFYRNTIEKLKSTDTTLADEEQKSSIPFLGMLQSVQRQVSALQRDGRQMRQGIGQADPEIRRLKGIVARLELRVSDLERDK